MNIEEVADRGPEENNTKPGEKGEVVHGGEVVWSEAQWEEERGFDRSL